MQYGGKITDGMDRILFLAYANSWVQPSVLAPNFTFNPEQPVGRIPNDFVYSIPDGSEIEQFQTFISSFPDVDSPEVIGLHPNADMTFRVKEVANLLNTIMETQPKTSSAGGGQTREQVVMEKASDLLGKLPEDYVHDIYHEKIGGMGGFDVPLNIFLYQEVQRLQLVIANVRGTLTVLPAMIVSDRLDFLRPRPRAERSGPRKCRDGTGRTLARAAPGRWRFSTRCPARACRSFSLWNPTRTLSSPVMSRTVGMRMMTPCPSTGHGRLMTCSCPKRRQAP